MNDNKKEGVAITTLYNLYSVYVLHIIDEWMETKSCPWQQYTVFYHIRI